MDTIFVFLKSAPTYDANKLCASMNIRYSKNIMLTMGTVTNSYILL